MKKIYIVMAVLATAVLASCEQEKSFDDKVFGENDVVFSIQNGVSTRSAEFAPEIRQGAIIPLESEDNGHTFFLEETVMNLDEFVPATKGTPAFTENVGTLYANNLSVYGDKGGFTTAKTFENESGGLLYKQSYQPNPWPSDGTAVGFYFNMPASPTYIGINGRTEGKITFTYTTPVSAEDQDDLLFAYRSLTKAKHDSYLKTSPYGAPVLFNHALTAVKFRIGNTAEDISTHSIKITEVIFEGLYDSGTCVITPAVEDDYHNKKNSDETLVYSSADAADWSTVTPKKSGNPISSGRVTSGTVEYKATDKKFGGTWYSDATSNTQNINDADATHTFWLMPQTMSDAVSLTIKYTFDGTQEKTWKIKDFGKYLKTKGGQRVTWKAGELRTYTLKVDDVNVTITDKMTPSEKNNVTITNTGNTAAFIRAGIIGQWLDDDNQPIFGYTDYTGGVPTPEYIPSWYEDFTKGTNIFGEFSDLAPSDSKWVKNASDGYYYYTEPVEPGESPTPLFSKYTIKPAATPKIYVGGIYKPAHLLIEVATQAVSAMNPDGTYRMNGNEYDYMGAWNEAKQIASKAPDKTN